MDLIDRVLMKMAPQRALARVRARTKATALMNYDAASRGRRANGWKAPATDADSASGASRSRLRFLSRDFVRNRPLAARARDVITGNVVGAGILPSVEMPAGASDRTEEAMTVIRAHLLTPAIDAYGVSYLPGLQRQVMNAVFTDGEVLVRRRLRDLRYEPDLKLPFQVQLLEVDHLDETLTSHGRNEVVDGIEYGPTGRAVAYHLYDRHPGDLLGPMSGRMTSRRVPASEILHIRRIDRPGQMRGVPWLAPVMMTLGEISDYQEAQILKQKIAALLAFFIEADEDGNVYEGAALEEVAPGAVVGLKSGQKMTAAEPPKVDGYGDFMREAVRSVAVGLGLTYESFGDLSKVSFISGRMGRMDMDRAVQVWQQVLIIAQFCEGLSRWTSDAWRLVERARGLPPVPDKIAWTAPGRPMLDPKEIDMALAEIEGGLTSLQRKQRERGFDPDVIARERAEDASRIAVPAGTRASVPSGAETTDENEESADERQ